jgi:hypothetical protein
LSNDIAKDIHLVGDTIFYVNISDNNRIYSIRTDGSGRKQINFDNAEILGIVSDRVIYRNNNDDGKLYSIDFDGNNWRILSDVWGDYDSGIYLTDDLIYYYYPEGNSISFYSMKADGSDRRLIRDVRMDELQQYTTVLITYFYVENDHIYFLPNRIYLNRDDPIFSMRTDGSDLRSMGDLVYCRGFTVAENRIYFWGTAFDEYYGMSLVEWILYSVGTDGSDYRTIVEDIKVFPYFHSGNVSGDRVYFIDANDNMLYSIGIDGTDRRLLYPSDVHSLTVVGERIYFYSTFGGGVKSMLLDGTQILFITSLRAG